MAVFPIAAYAATPEELRAQIDELLRRVQALSAAAPTTVATGGQCPLISRTLKIGSAGADVTRLQQFLARDKAIYPEGTISGYYGALTEAAVKRFQCKNQIVCSGDANSTGYGVTGPRTAALLALQCPGGSTGTSNAYQNVGGFIRVTPVSGEAPLTVTVEATVNTTRSCNGGSYELNYGDNTAPVFIAVPIGGCGELRQSFAHRYANAGTYTVRLRAGGHESSATVTVTGQGSISGTSDTFDVSPKSGNAPLNVSFTGKANASGSCSPGSYRISFGDGTNDANIPVSDCSVSTYAVTHGYNANGTYIARLLKGGSEVTSTTIRVGSGSNTSSPGGGSFSVSPGHGGDAFAVLATFTIPSSCTAYEINWGDGTPYSSQNAGTCSSGTVTKEVTHTYTGNGTYTITLKRGSGSGQTTDSVGVTIVY